MPGRRQRPDAEDGGVLSQRLAHTLLRAGIDGVGRFESAAALVGRLCAGDVPPERVVRDVVRLHTRLVAGGGFVTGLGGFLTMPVALPANVVSFYTVATRMVAAIATARGYDVRRDSVRTAVLLVLAGRESADILRAAGVLSRPGSVTTLALSRLSGPMLMVVNKAVGFRLLVGVGQRGLARLGRAVPLAGGVAGAGLDVMILRGIAREADRYFPPRPHEPAALGA